MVEHKGDGGYLLSPTFLNFRANPTLGITAMEEGKTRLINVVTQVRPPPSPPPSILKPIPPSRLREVSGLYVSASDEHLTQNLGKRITPENLWACDGDDSHITVQSGWTDRGEDTVV